MLNQLVKRVAIIAAVGAFLFWLAAFHADGVTGWRLVVLAVWWGGMSGAVLIFAGWVLRWALGALGRVGAAPPRNTYQVVDD